MAAELREAAGKDGRPEDLSNLDLFTFIRKNPAADPGNSLTDALCGYLEQNLPVRFAPNAADFVEKKAPGLVGALRRHELASSGIRVEEPDPDLKFTDEELEAIVNVVRAIPPEDRNLVRVIRRLPQCPDGHCAGSSFHEADAAIQIYNSYNPERYPEDPVVKLLKEHKPSLIASWNRMPPKERLKTFTAHEFAHAAIQRRQDAFRAPLRDLFGFDSYAAFNAAIPAAMTGERRTLEEKMKTVLGKTVLGRWAALNGWHGDKMTGVFLRNERDPFLVNEGLVHSLFFTESDESVTHTFWHRFQTTWTVTDPHFVISEEKAVNEGPEQTLAETYAFYVVNPQGFEDLAARDATIARQLEFLKKEFF